MGVVLCGSLPISFRAGVTPVGRTWTDRTPGRLNARVW